MTQEAAIRGHGAQGAIDEWNQAEEWSRSVKDAEKDPKKYGSNIRP
jgi:hypothetical protein